MFDPALILTHLTMKSNSEPASMRTPSRVEKAPSSTGANMCSRARRARLLRSPMAVRKACRDTHSQRQMQASIQSSFSRYYNYNNKAKVKTKHFFQAYEKAKLISQHNVVQ